jgi:hypothetical protein
VAIAKRSLHFGIGRLMKLPSDAEHAYPLPVHPTLGSNLMGLRSSNIDLHPFTTGWHIEIHEEAVRLASLSRYFGYLGDAHKRSRHGTPLQGHWRCGISEEEGLPPRGLARSLLLIPVNVRA